jgi:valyl-tRNA synthetase
MELGTGAVKMTPAHDPNDFALGERHGLEFINILNDDGTLTDNCGPFSVRAYSDCHSCSSH